MAKFLVSISGALVVVSGLFMFAPSFTRGDVSFSPLQVFAFGTGGTGGCCGGSARESTTGDNENDQRSSITRKPAPVCSMDAWPKTIKKGESATLSWNSMNATRARMNQGIGLVSVDGSRVVSPTVTTIYTITFIGNDRTVTCSKTIYVTPPKPAPTCSMWSNPATITRGQSAALSWDSQNAHTASVDQGIGSVTVDGSTVVSPQNTTTYTGTFTGENGTVTCTATVVVHTPVPSSPACQMYFSQSSITPGQGVVLTWNSQNTYSGWVSGGVGGVTVNGSTTVYPTQSTTYTGTFYGSSGQFVNCSAPITVSPIQNAPSCTILINNYQNSQYYKPGQAVTIAWSSTNATSVSINNGIGNVALNGSRAVSPNQTTTYTATAYGHNGQTAQCSVTVNYLPPQTPYITLTQVPYTGLDFGPIGNAVYWSFLAIWSVMAAYLIAVKKVHYDVARVLESMLFGEKETTDAPENTTPELAPEATLAVSGISDPFLASQILRN